MDLPFRNEREVQRPAALEPFDNGHIPLVRLHKCGLRGLVLSAPAARAVRAMVAAAGRDGIALTATGTYRTLDQQLAMFAERYRPCTQAEADRLPKAQKKNWNGQWFALQRNANGALFAMAAVPGTSNHGLGCAVDFSATPPIVGWLAQNGPTYGFFNTVKGEEWHWCWVHGDHIPDVILQHEGETGVAPIIDDVDVAVGGVLPPTELDAASVELLTALARATQHELAFGMGGPEAPPDVQDAVIWAKTFLNRKLGIDGTGFALALTPAFDDNADRGTRQFQANVRQFMQVPEEEFPADGRVDSPVWFWLTRP